MVAANKHPLCIVRIAPNKLKCIMKQKDGRVEEWMRCQTADGNMVWHGRCVNSIDINFGPKIGPKIGPRFFIPIV